LRKATGICDAQTRCQLFLWPQVRCGVIRVEDKRYAAECGHDLLEKLQPLPSYVSELVVKSRDIPAGAREASDQSLSHRVGALAKMIGIVLVARLAAQAACESKTTITSTGIWTTVAISSGNRSGRPPCIVVQ
jgi:hypothetical protein